VDGKVLHFRLAGINNQNFIMEDVETHSWWQQVSGEAILGPLKGKRLSPMAWDEVSFAIWKSEHPEGHVLRADARFQAHYVPSDWETRILKRPTVTPAAPTDPLKPRDLVIGIDIGGLAKAYPVDLLRKEKLISDTLASTPLILVAADDGRSVRCFNRRAGTLVLDLFMKPDTRPLLLVDSQTGSEWDFSGTAATGPLAGQSLEPVQTLKDFWFDWKLYHPKTSIYAAGQLPQNSP
jgi:hypothetical protein